MNTLFIRDALKTVVFPKQCVIFPICWMWWLGGRSRAYHSHKNPSDASDPCKGRDLTDTVYMHYLIRPLS